jgi:hypothetical protein
VLQVTQALPGLREQQAQPDRPDPPGQPGQQVPRETLAQQVQQVLPEMLVLPAPRVPPDRQDQPV